MYNIIAFKHPHIVQDEMVNLRETNKKNAPIETNKNVLLYLLFIYLVIFFIYVGYFVCICLFMFLCFRVVFLFYFIYLFNVIIFFFTLLSCWGGGGVPFHTSIKPRGLDGIYCSEKTGILSL